MDQNCNVRILRRHKCDSENISRPIICQNKGLQPGSSLKSYNIHRQTFEHCLKKTKSLYRYLTEDPKFT
jgi:hypothetical protein